MGGGAICGGVISESYFKKRLAKKDGIYGIMMAFVIPDEHYKKYIVFRKENKDKEAKELFNKYARSII